MVKELAECDEIATYQLIPNAVAERMASLVKQEFLKAVAAKERRSDIDPYVGLVPDAAEMAGDKPPKPWRSRLSPTHPPRLRIQSAVWKKLPLSRSRRSPGTPVSPMAWSMQASHWSRSRMQMEFGAMR